MQFKKCESNSSLWDIHESHLICVYCVSTFHLFTITSNNIHYYLQSVCATYFWILTVWASCPGSLHPEASPLTSTPWAGRHCLAVALHSQTKLHISYCFTGIRDTWAIKKRNIVAGTLSQTGYSLEMTWKPSQKSRTFTSEMMAQFLQLTRSTSWSPNSSLKASGCQRWAFSRLCIPDTNTGWMQKRRDNADERETQ